MCLFTALLDELWFFAKDAGCEGIFSLKLTLVITLAVIDGSIVSNGIAGALFIIELHVAIKNAFDLITAAALTNFEIHEELFLDPAVQRLVDGVVRGFTGTGHGTDDVGILD